MHYIQTKFRDFINDKLNETNKSLNPAETQLQQINDARSWIDELKEKFEEITKDYDDLYK